MSSTANAIRSSGPAPSEGVASPGVAVPGAASLGEGAGHGQGTARFVFAPDDDGDDRLGRASGASFLAQLLVHRDAGTPFLVGLFGHAGSGKSTFIRQVLEAVSALAKGPAQGRADSSVVPRVVTARVDASADADPATTILAGVFSALGRDYPGLAEDAIHAGGDPVKAASAAGERVNDLRRRLDSERQVLDEIGGRRARLAETVLFDSPGSGIDAYARANRGRIETRLRSFGLPATDAVASFKEQVREAAEGGGSAARWTLLLRAMWNYKGQAALVVLAVLLFLLAWLSGTLADNQPGVEAWLTGVNDRFAGPAGWMRDHLSWLLPIGRAALGLGVLALLANVLRAFRFVQPIAKGAGLLAGDLQARRRDLDSLQAHQTRRVEQLSTEVDHAVRRAEAAQRRADARGRGMEADPHVSFGGTELTPAHSALDVARSFFEALSTAMRGAAMPTRAATDGAAPAASEGRPETPAPSRIVVAIDGLDRLPAPAAARMLEAAHDLLGRPNIVAIAAAERAHLLSGLSETDPALAWARLDRAVQLSYDLDADSVSSAALVESLLPGGAAARSVSAGSVQTGTLDKPWQTFERELVSALAPLSGRTPRAIKRFVNTYGVARADPRLSEANAAELAGLAAALALDGRGGAAELQALDLDHPSAEAGLHPASDLGPALAAVRAVVGPGFALAEARRGLQVARTYSRGS